MFPARCSTLAPVWGAFLACCLLPAIPASSQSAAQWDFDDSLNPSIGAGTLNLGFAAPATASLFYFTNSNIQGVSAKVGYIGRGTFLRAAHLLGKNGGGAAVNQYTLIMDVMFPERPSNFTALLQTGTANSTDADWFIRKSPNGIGISGIYGGSVPVGEWTRLALVVDNVGKRYVCYVNGQKAMETSTGLTLDGRFALFASTLFFADNDQETGPVLINSLQLRNETLPAEEIATLGGPEPQGLPLPVPGNITITSPAQGSVLEAGLSTVIRWTTTNPVGSLRVDWMDGKSRKAVLGTVPASVRQLAWTLDATAGDGTNYTIRLTSLTDTNLQFFSGVFSVTDSIPLNPLYGQSLQKNGGFEEGLTNWTIQAGTPQVLTRTQGKGTPRSGDRFLHGGIRSRSPEAVTRQIVDLTALGFVPRELSQGSVMESDVWVRNALSAPEFDDQVFVRIGYLNSQDEALGWVRCIIPADSAWSRKLLRGLLPPGTRKLAVEVVGKHRRSPDNDTMADDIVVRLTRPGIARQPVITKLPMLQDYRTNAMTLIWETDFNLCLHSVEWGLAGHVLDQKLTSIETLQIDDTHYVHRAELTGLQTETGYSYRVRSGEAVSKVYTFTTAPHRETSFAVAWWGDNHEGIGTLKTHVSNIVQHAPNFIAVAGDMVNSGNSITEWHDYWFKPLEHMDVAQTIPVLFARGNHDGEHALAYAYSVLPGNGGYYSFPYGNSWFLFLDSEAPSSSVPEQLIWLNNELRRPEVQQAAFRIACFHKPPWTDFWNGGGYTGEDWVRSDWTPVFEQNSVDLVISGHTHAYSRGSTNGVMYVVSGGGGGTVDTERVARWPLFQAEYTDTHFDLMEISGCHMDWRAFNARNQLIDQFRLRCRAPELRWGSQPTSGSPLQLITEGRPGNRYILERSSNMTTWTPVITNAIPTRGSPEFSVEVVPKDTREFFRARQR